MIAHFLRGYSWEPAPVFDLYVSDPAVVERGQPRSDSGVARAPHSDRLTPRQSPSVAVQEPGVRWAVAHLHRYLSALEEQKAEGHGSHAPEALYLVDGTEQALREVVGFRLRGHPMALMGAFIFPRHRRSQVPNGRPSLASFLSKPPRTIGYRVDPVPPGHTTLFLPHVTESIPSFMERLREQGGSGITIDANVVDVAFDLRFSNPSEIRQHSYKGARAGRSVFRTIAGHVVSGVSVGLSQTLHTDDRFVTLTRAIQHRPGGDVPLPTIAVNRSILALQSRLPDGQPDDAVRSTLAFHPDTACPEHLLGAPYDDRL